MGVAALSGPVDQDRLEQGLDGLRRLGFEPVTAANVGVRRGFFAGGDEDRLAAFHELAADPQVSAIVFARGGHGVMRLLSRLDWEVLARRPRAYLGYSDLTPFLLEVVRRLGIVAFHGPMAAVEVARGLTDDEAGQLLACLVGEPPPVPIDPMGGEPGVPGPLLGGCLSLLTATLGTPFAPRLDGAVLFWEDVAEPLYRVDRMLTQLRLAGALAGIRGMVVGQSVAGRDAAVPDLLRELLVDLRGAEDWPIAVGCASGHSTPNLTLPLGATAELDMEGGRLLLGSSSAGTGSAPWQPLNDR